jgi:transmembrane sensor
MSDPETDPPPGDGLLREAAAWFARMRGPDANASRPEFETWLARGALHRRAYNRVSEVFAMGKMLGEPDALPSQRRAYRMRQPMLIAAAVLIMVMTAAGLTLRFLDTPKSGRDSIEGASNVATSVAFLENGPDRQRTFQLSDGSRVSLDAGTSLAIRYSHTTRTLALQAGGARFDVAHDSRPFVVHAGGGAVTAHGTIFDVAFAADHRVSVRLLEGIVEVSTPAPTNQPSGSRILKLSPGQSVSFAAAAAPGSGTSRPQQQPASVARSPISSEPQDYDGVRVDELIAAANAGQSRRIRLADPTLGERRLSGRFRVNDPDQLAERLAGLFNLIVDRRDPSEIVLRAR